ncbi:hypothetical protein MKW98_004131, partial [Papaver atlanticum]
MLLSVQVLRQLWDYKRYFIQNHLLQLLTLFAMKTPVSLNAGVIRNEKVKVLSFMKPLQLDFGVKAGKALHTRRAEIRVQFRHVPAIYMKINNKVPGLGMKLDRSNLNLHYASRLRRIAK